MQEYEVLKAEIDALAQEASVHLSSRAPLLSSRATTRDPWIAGQARNDNLVVRNDDIECNDSVGRSQKRTYKISLHPPSTIHKQLLN